MPHTGHCVLSAGTHLESSSVSSTWDTRQSTDRTRKLPRRPEFLKVTLRLLTLEFTTFQVCSAASDGAGCSFFGQGSLAVHGRMSRSSLLTHISFDSCLCPRYWVLWFVRSHPSCTLPSNPSANRKPTETFLVPPSLHFTLTRSLH